MAYTYYIDNVLYSASFIPLVKAVQLGVCSVFLYLSVENLIWRDTGLSLHRTTHFVLIILSFDTSLYPQSLILCYPLLLPVLSRAPVYWSICRPLRNEELLVSSFGCRRRRIRMFVCNVMFVLFCFTFILFLYKVLQLH